MAGLRTAYNRQRDKKGLPKLTEQDDGVQPDIEAALWAWVNFGGIGARTRRGCGALYCEDFASSSAEELESWFAGWMKRLGRPVTLSDLSVPIIESAPLVSPNAQTSLKAWADAVDLMRQFRQEGVGRKPRPNPAQRLSKSNLPGRSYWLEPESIRNYADQRATRHSRLPHIPEDAFPRAEFGLPMVFHFSNRDDPDECELYPANKMRMASPIILRPLAVGDGRKALAMVLRLRAPAPDGLELKKVGKPPSLCRSNISRPDLAKYKNSPMGESQNVLPENATLKVSLRIRGNLSIACV